LPFRPAFFNHPCQQLTGEFHILCLSGTRQECHHRRTDGEVGEVPQLLNPLKWVHVPVVSQIQQRLSTHFKAWILQQNFDLRNYRFVTACIQNANCFLAYFGGRVVQ